MKMRWRWIPYLSHTWGLKNLAEYYYDQSVRDSLEYYCSLVDSIAKARHEYPNVLFDVKSLFLPRSPLAWEL